MTQAHALRIVRITPPSGRSAGGGRGARAQAGPPGPRALSPREALARELAAGPWAGMRLAGSEGREVGLLQALLDTLRAGVLLVDRARGALHLNGALLDLLEEERDPGRLRSEIHRFAASLSRAAPAVEYCTVAGDYRMRGHAVSLDAQQGELVVVAVERMEAALPSDAELRARYDLTAQEIRVARLIAEGKSNAEIARAMFVSPHTARHHTERILKKLQARSRSEVAARLLSTAADHPPS